MPVTVMNPLRAPAVPVSRVRVVLALCCTWLLASCAFQPVFPGRADSPQPVTELPDQFAASYEDQVADCRAALSASVNGTRDGIDPGDIRVLNWNVQKKRHDGWREDFDRLASESDLVLMQEAYLGGFTESDFADWQHWSFAPGHSMRSGITGVLTLSRSEPIARCNFSSVEPWLRTPKSTSVTTFALSGSDKVLAVVNVHALLVSFGLHDYRLQFERIADILQDHEGPIIVAGDFNTWHKRRMQVVDELAASLDLQPVTFDEDTRMRFFGIALDHIYVRQLQLVNAETATVYTSDHNPLLAVLSMPFAAP